MDCEQAASLLEAYAEATREYFAATIALSNLVGSPEQFSAARKRAEETRGKSQAAYLVLVKHRAGHNCYVAVFPEKS